jgi:7-carboxy-7-deazaguanine synthase
MTLTTILKKVSQHNCKLVEVTGGEPLIQPDTPDLIYQLIEKNYEVMLETNGTVDISGIDNRCIKVMDIKCPSSNETGKNNFNNIKHLTTKDQIKFVIASREDFEYAKAMVNEYHPEIPYDHILFSPVFNQMPYDTLAKWILDDHLNVRLHLQIHKLIWPDKDRGV